MSRRKELREVEIVRCDRCGVEHASAWFSTQKPDAPNTVDFCSSCWTEMHPGWGIPQRKPRGMVPPKPVTR